MVAAPWTFDLGATVLKEGGTRFRVWAPKSQSVNLLVLSGKAAGTVPMLQEEKGYYSVTDSTSRFTDCDLRAQTRKRVPPSFRTVAPRSKVQTAATIETPPKRETSLFLSTGRCQIKIY